MGEESSRDDKELCHQEYIIMAEYQMLQTENLEGIYVIPSNEKSFLWFGVIFIRSGFYKGGVFRFTITLPEQFPNNEVPVLTFTSHIYHPAVDSDTGILNLSAVFPQWDKNKDHIWQILKYLLCVFHNVNVKVPVNEEASASFKTNKKLFMDKVRECIASSTDHLYDEPPTDDKHYITFTPYNPSIHDSAINKMLKPTDPTEGMNQGMSWIQQGSFQPFSKEETT